MNFIFYSPKRILRPAFFMDNFDGAIGKITSAVLKAGLKKDTKVQFIVSITISTTFRSLSLIQRLGGRRYWTNCPRRISIFGRLCKGGDSCYRGCTYHHGANGSLYSRLWACTT